MILFPSRSFYLVFVSVSFKFPRGDRVNHTRALGDIQGYLELVGRRERGRDPAPTLSGSA